VTVNDGYTWDGWSGDLTGTTKPATITMDAPKSVTANFTTVNPVQITITTSPSGLEFTADGTSYTAPHTFTWTEGSSHTIAVSSPQYGASGTIYVYSSWSDGGGQSHTYTVPSSNDTVTANFSVVPPDDVEDIAHTKLPTEFALAQNFPNPFNPETVISYSTPKPAQIRIEIYNAIGKKIRTLVDDYVQAGQHQIIWDGKNDNGIQVSTGIYYYIMQSGSFRSMKKAVFMK